MFFTMENLQDKLVVLGTFGEFVIVEHLWDKLVLLSPFDQVRYHQIMVPTNAIRWTNDGLMLAHRSAIYLDSLVIDHLLQIVWKKR